jgi:hypothetical protein
MLKNDVVGDCAIAGPYHALMLWNREADKTIRVTDQCTLKTYSAVTGYDPKQDNPVLGNPTDQGANVEEVAEYWRTKGFNDADGKNHKIDCYVALEPGNVDELWVAMYLFDGVGIGVSLPEAWMADTRAGRVWDIPRGSAEIAGGHYVLGVGRRGGLLNVVTWGQTQLVTPRAYAEFNDETLAYLDTEKLVNGKSLEGFNLAQLKDDLLQLANQPLHVRPKTAKKKEEPKPDAVA